MHNHDRMRVRKRGSCFKRALGAMKKKAGIYCQRQKDDLDGFPSLHPTQRNEKGEMILALLMKIQDRFLGSPDFQENIGMKKVQGPDRK